MQSTRTMSPKLVALYKTLGSGGSGEQEERGDALGSRIPFE